MKKFAVVLAGCGVFDGAEIHEATLTLLAIAQQNGTYQCFAPDMEQYHVINHLTGEITSEKRNVLVEAARIARGNIKPLSGYHVDDFDALIFPGGFGAAKNLSTIAFHGADATVNIEVEKAVKQNLSAGKPIGALCIAPAFIAKIIGDVSVTLGKDPKDAETIEKMGARHVNSDHGEVIIDKKYRVFTTPCYMLNATITDIYNGAFNIVKEINNFIE